MQAAPHHRLLALGVRPGQQRQGVGRASLAATGARFLPCYADVHTPRAVHFAQQQGFEVARYGVQPTKPANTPCWELVRAAGPV